MRRAVCLLLLAFILPLPVFAGKKDDDYGRILEKYRERMKRHGLLDKAGAIRLLDPNNSRSLPELLKVLTSPHWFLRGKAAEALSKVTSPPLRAELRLKLLTSKKLLVRDGIALAFDLSPEKGDADALSGALDDGSWEVRRTAAIALAGIVSKASIAALIAALVKEKDPRVAVQIAATLEKITGRSFGRDAKAWRLFWERHKDDPGLAGLKDEKKRRNLAGIPFETVTVAKPESGRKPTREPLDFFVLPPFGFDHEVYRPYLDQLSDYGRVTYVNLPSVKEVTGLSGYGETIPTFPVRKFVKALEKLREKLGKRRVIVFGEGATGWIAEAYALTYPKRTAGLIVLDGFVDSASYGAALARLLRSPDASERFLAETLTGKNGLPHDRSIYRVLTRIGITMDLVDRSDSRGYLIWKYAQDPQGFATVPDIRLPPRMKVTTPALFYWGAQSRLTGYPEASRIRAHFPNAILAPLLESKGYGYVSEYSEFYRILRGFLDVSHLR